jgi:TPR repeat protein
MRMEESKCYNALGLMYQRGDFVKKDIVKAYTLFKSKSFT